MECKILYGSERNIEMAGKGGATPATYTPSPTTIKEKKKPSLLADIDWVRLDGRGFQQCRPACMYTLLMTFILPMYVCIYLLLLLL